MTNLLKIMTNVILVSGLTVFAAGAASAASTGGAGNGNGGHSSDGRGYGGPGNRGGENPGGGNPHLGVNVVQRDLHRPRYGMIIQRYRRPAETGNQTCAHLYFLINQSNMMKTVPDYQECLRKNGS